MTRAARMLELIQKTFLPIHVELENESHKHSVPENSETHFKLVLVSERFESQSRVQRARLVHEVLATELQSGLHAISQRLFSPQEWSTAKNSAVSESPPCAGARTSSR